MRRPPPSKWAANWHKALERATGRILDLCRTAPILPLEEQMDREARSMVASLGDPEAAEGIAAVLGRRSADFVSLRRSAR